MMLRKKADNGVSKKRDFTSPQSHESTDSANTPTRKLNNNDDSTRKANGGPTPNRNSDLQNDNALRTPSDTTLATMKTPTIRKTPTPRRGHPIGTNLHRTPSLPFKDSNHNGIVSKTGSAVMTNNNNNNNNSNLNNNNNNNNNSVKSVSSFQNKSLRQTQKGIDTVHVKNGCIHGPIKEINKGLIKQLMHNSKAFESLAILLSYCANDLDAFSMPHLKKKLEVEKQKFVQAESDIKDLQLRLIRARQELNDKEVVITELNNDKINLGEKSEKYEKLVEELTSKLDVVSEEKLVAESTLLQKCENLRCLKRELSNRTDKFENEKDSLVNCLSEAKKENVILKSANREIKEEYDKCLLENQRLVEQITKRQNEVVRVGKENHIDAEDVVRTRQRNNSFKEKSPERLNASQNVCEKSFRNPVSASPNAFNPNCLESEIESLRQVLALKTDEVTELRRQELSLRENADRVPKLLSTITMLEGKVEDLQSQLSSQTETVRDLFKSNEHLEDELKSANIQKTRLTHKNEELQYKLKQYAEAMKQLATQKNLSEKSLKSDNLSVKSNSKKSDVSLDDSVKSQMKGVVEKSDSVSYMLEMTEDSSEIVTNIIRRAESLRSTSKDQALAKKKRSKASSLSYTDASSIKRNLSVEDEFSPGSASTPKPSPSEFEFDRHMILSNENNSNDCDVSPSRLLHAYSAKKHVKLNEDDFSTALIDLGPEGDNCEIIEITKNFDKTDKNSEMMMTTSTSSTTSSSSTSNGSHFDIESDVFSNLENDQNVMDPDEDTENSEMQENGSIIRTYRREKENIQPVLPVYTDLDDPSPENHFSNSKTNGGLHNQYVTNGKNFVTIPKISGGETMIGLSSDDEEIEKIKRIYNE